MKVGRTEAEVLHILQREGRLSNVDLAARVGLSESPCFRRVKALEEAGIIEHYAAHLNQRAVGLQVTAFVQVSLEKQEEKRRQTFLAQVEAEEHIVECHATSGAQDYLLKVVARNMEHFSELAMRRILNFEGVSNIESNFSLEAIKEHSPLPVRDY